MKSIAFYYQRYVIMHYQKNINKLIVPKRSCNKTNVIFYATYTVKIWYKFLLKGNIQFIILQYNITKVCAYIQTYIHTRIHTCILTYVHTYILEMLVQTLALPVTVFYAVTVFSCRSAWNGSSNTEHGRKSARIRRWLNSRRETRENRINHCAKPTDPW